jgi:hypothetical protein
LVLNGDDGKTDNKRQHRKLVPLNAAKKTLGEFLRGAVIAHHNSPDKLQRMKRINALLGKQGLAASPLYPENESTRKGNVAEILLAEYVATNESLKLPIYRLRHNPNVDQSMKGDDVLAFDLAANPVRIVVGESKFRSAPRREDVEEIVDGLKRSQKAKIPVSLQFVAEMLYLQGDVALARSVEASQVAIARGSARVEYVGLLLSNDRAEHCVKTYTPTGSPRRLAMISLCVDDPVALVSDCFRDLR